MGAGNRSSVRSELRGLQPEKVWSLHEFRHYLGSKVSKGRDPGRSGACCGTRTQTSAARYLHATAGDLREAVAQLPAALPEVGSGKGGDAAASESVTT